MEISYSCALELMSALSEKNMNAFINLLYQEFHFPCVALDAAHRTIAIAPEEHLTGDAYWDAATQLRKTSEELLTHVYDYGYTEEIVHGSKCNQIVELTWGDIRYPHMASAIIDDGNIIGYTNLLFVGPADAHDDALEIAGILRDGVCTIMKSQKQNGQPKAQELKVEFAAKLFSHRFFTEKEIYSWAKTCGINLSASYAVLCVDSTTEAHFDAGYFNSLMRALYPSCIYETIGGVNYLFLYGINSLAHLNTIIREFSQRIMSSYTLGVSMIFEDITSIDIYVEQSKKAFVYGKNADQEGRVFYYEEHQIQILKNAIKGNGSYKVQLPQVFQTLAAYDAKNDTFYEQTLIHYLKNFGDKQKTTAQLSIHRNTLKYRLNKIEELCNVNLEDANFLRKLFLCYYMCT